MKTTERKTTFFRAKLHFFSKSFGGLELFILTLRQKTTRRISRNTKTIYNENLKIYRENQESIRE